MRRELIANIITFAAVLVVGVVVLVFGYLDVRPGTQYTRLVLTLGNTSQLAERSPVLLRGVRVGEVSKVSPHPGGVDVTVKYDDKYRIPRDSAISVEQLSALGEPYVEFAPRTDGGPCFTDGATVEPAAITQYLTVAQVFQAFASLNRATQAGPVGDLVTTAWQATANTDEQMPKLTRAGDLLAATLMSRMPGIRQMFADTQAYSADLQWLPPTLDRLGPAFDSTVRTIRDAVEDVQRMIQVLDAPKPFDNVLIPFVTRLTPYLRELIPSLATTSGPFLAILSAIDRTAPQIDLSAFLSNALNAVAPDGTARLTITVPAPR
ncbi:MlaD family protein [Tsukamurella spumae]|uniref:MCE family protein n=1 Tax=Tsukamurella spumae TaxID=44753 RepID=A0A846WXK8_9ACTN|nr:MlaD family protein [Tsukamurella spumae]NKY17631.1 MCE family protein [Tsukamurella spumae]